MEGRGGRVKGRREDGGRKGVVVWEEKRHEVLANHICYYMHMYAMLAGAGEGGPMRARHTP